MTTIRMMAPSTEAMTAMTLTFRLKTFVGGGYGSYGTDHHGSFSSGGGDCCPLVVDPLTYAALLGFIALATYFFNVQIAASMLARSYSLDFSDWIMTGKHWRFF